MRGEAAEYLQRVGKPSRVATSRYRSRSRGSRHTGRMRLVGRTRTVQHRIEPVLGTRMDVSITASSRRGSDAVLRDVLAEIDRLEKVFSIFDPNSELSRWKHAGEQNCEVSKDLADLLQRGAEWHGRTAGLFNPNLGGIRELWKHAEKTAQEPNRVELKNALEVAAALPYELNGRQVRKIASCAGLDFNAIAKGLIVDRAVAAAWDQQRPEMLLLNLGGDLRHRGTGSVTVKVEDPADRSAAALTEIVVSNAAVATSGTSWRGFTIGDQSFGHVLDPRTGRPTNSMATATATVVSADAATADVVATALTVLDIDEGSALAESLGPLFIDYFLLSPDRRTRHSTTWPRQQTASKGS